MCQGDPFPPFILKFRLIDSSVDNIHLDILKVEIMIIKLYPSLLNTKKFCNSC